MIYFLCSVSHGISVSAMPRSILKPHLKPNHDSLDSMWKMQHDSQSSMATPMRQPLGRFEGVTGNIS